jgi:hypothetical protein
MSALIKRFTEIPRDETVSPECVTYADHLASHAFDEAKERELFEGDFNTLELHGGLNSWTGRWEYDHPHVNSLWRGWLRCAKSRAKAAGCE